MATTVRKKAKPSLTPLRRSLALARTFMDQGDLAQAVDVLENFYEQASEMEWEDGPGLKDILDEGRRLAGELRGRMSMVAMSGRHGLGARAEPPIAKMDSAMEKARDLLKRGYHSSALDLVETIHQALWYWEDTGHPEVQRLLDEARKLSGQIRAETSGGSIGATSPETRKQYTSGGCPHLAIALHERTGWPLAMLWDEGLPEESYGDENTYPSIAHVFVLTPEGMAADIDGIRPLEALKEQWYDLIEPRINELTLNELKGLMGNYRPLERCGAKEMREARKMVDEILGDDLKLR